MKIKLNKLKEAIKAVVNEQDLKVGDRVGFKADPKAIWKILGIQGTTYRINQEGQKSISYQPMSWLHNMIATGKASIKEQGEGIKEDSSSPSKGYTVARDLIAKLRATTFRKFNDDELEEFRKTIADAFDMSLKEGSLEERVVSDNESPSLKAKIAADDFMYQYRKTLRIVDGNHGKEAGEEFKNIVKAKFAQLQEGLNEDKGTLDKIADILGDKFDDLNFDVNEPADRIDVRGSQQDLANFGDKLHGEKIYGYEVFATDDDDRGEIVRIVKSDKLKEGDGLWANIRAKKARGEKPARKGSKAYKIAKKAGDKINKEK